MRAGGGKQKGSQFERDVCCALSRWISEGKREDLFWRSAMSGGRATVGRKSGKDHAKHAGDISATDPLGHQLTDRFYIECKFYADLKFGSWLLEDVGPLAGFWKIAKEQAEAHKLAPMLIIKQNRSDIFMVVPAPHILAPNAAGIGHFNPLACVARLHKAQCDVYRFESVLAKPFKPWVVQSAGPMLKPGELNYLLNVQMGGHGNKKEPKITDRSEHFNRVDKWVNTKRRRDGVLRRALQGDPDDEVSDSARPGTPRTKPVRIKA